MFQYFTNKFLNIIIIFFIICIFLTFECENGYYHDNIINIITNLKQNQIETEPKLNFLIDNNLSFYDENKKINVKLEDFIEMHFSEKKDLIQIDTLKIKINFNNQIINLNKKIINGRVHFFNISSDSHNKYICKILDPNYYYYNLYYDKYLDTINNLYICSYWRYGGE